MIYPYVGHDIHDGDVCVTARMSMGNNGGSCQDYDAYQRQQEYRKNLKADESTKHTLYTEEQRYAMADFAARRLYPIQNYQFTLAFSVAEETMIQYDREHLNIPTNNCNLMTAEHMLTPTLQNRMPEEAIYQAIAQGFNETYSDQQLAEIYRAAQTTGITPALNEALKPQPPLYPVIPSEAESFIHAYAREHNDMYLPEAAQAYQAVVASRRYAQADRCTVKFNAVTRQTEIERLAH